MTAVWLFSFFLMWKDSRCHRWLLREAFRSVWAQETDLPLELKDGKMGRRRKRRGLVGEWLGSRLLFHHTD